MFLPSGTILSLHTAFSVSLPLRQCKIHHLRPRKQISNDAQVKQVSRERPLTHERPHTRNPRDPRNVPARENVHVSPKTKKNNDHHQRGGNKADGRGSKKAGLVGASLGSSSFPSLSMPLSGWGAGEGGTPYAGAGGASGEAPRSRGGHGVISMTKPKDILVQGLLR